MVIVNKYVRLLITLSGFITVMILFGYQAGFAGADEYTTMSSQVSAGYPLFLLAIRKIVGVSKYFWTVSLIQNIIAGLGVWFVAESLSDYVELPQWLKYVSMLCFATPYFVPAFLQESEMVISCAILPEGITLSLYYIMLGLLGRIMEEGEIGWYISIGFALGILSLIKPQMMIACLIIIVIVLAKGVSFDKLRFSFISIVIGVAVLVGGNALYKTMAVGGEGTYNVATAVTNVFCVSDEEDAELFKNDEKVVFERIIAKLKDKNYTMPEHTYDPLRRAEHLEQVHDSTKNDVIYSTIYEYLKNEKGITNYKEQSKYVKAMLYDYLLKLSHKHPLRFLINCFGLGIVGLVRTNASYAFPYTLVSVYIYILFFAFRELCWKKDANKSISLSRITLALVLANAFGVATVIICLPQYMMFNFSLFYFSLISLMYSATKQ